ncbi:LysR family transcriptional regulator [Algihabitans albus]|uniref:LysR family transcriptional regulator n=1 Tax=Algihabitans albus TaxID=2164067 RepID=UPI000E5D118F|nr:LysR family transcriptional regulator [Algihabitans albus]
MDLLPIKMQHLLNLLIVAETGSFRKAGTHLDIGQSAVSRRVQRLEDLLGVSLFERRPGGARLTPVGNRFAERVRRILDDLNEAIEAAQSGAVAQIGVLRLGLIESFSRGPLRGVIERFLAEYADVELNLIESDRSDLFTLLSHRRIDLVYAAGMPTPEIGDGLLLANETIFLAVPSQHQWACRERLSWKEIEAATFIVSAREPGPAIHDYIVRRTSNLGRVASVRRHRFGREGIMSLVGLGLGVSLVADHWRGVRYPNVTFVPLGDEDERVPFSLSWRPENDNPALRRFLSLARIEAKRNGALS